ncbi:type 1 glutamine amidotransferase [Bdellovibrio sp. SKB1291214]|uniref:type 1 glutamine amidotransferase n=1 Tax=Bdellovibrio sp. SKB1291214 TaxID=1732569 RepID=UPI000B515CF7|nr:type 1 glutamine amidotransferase [Bdellovibrio sp. SKB1291214]UYL10271.1 type 1 glutamine amidotransferase [Bdellovibrio sp. SKB1291214]
MHKLLVIQHQSTVPAGSTLEWAAKNNILVEYWHPAEGEPIPDRNSYSMVVICGGTANTFEEEKFPWLRAEKKFLRELIQKDTKIFGLCLGAQLLADVLGEKVYVHPAGWESGFVEVRLNDGSKLNAFQSHLCTFDLPKGAELIATNDFCKNQAYRLGRNIMATQFHPETTIEWIKYNAEKDLSSRAGNVQTKEQMLGSLELQKPLQDWYFKQLDSFFLRT